MRAIPWLVWSILLPLLAQEAAADPSQLVFRPGDSDNFISFVNPKRPGQRIGYRLHEHLPLVAGEIPETLEEAGLNDVETENTLSTFRSRPGVFIQTRQVVEEGWTPQTWTFYFAPVETGFEALWTVETMDRGLEQYYSAQQCFRLGGKTNQEWRRTIAETPDFSEYDYWSALAEEGKPKESLTWVRRNQRWRSVPPVENRLVSATPEGKRLEETGGLDTPQVLEILDPKHAGEMSELVDGGLILRTNPEETWVCGIYWERTTHVSNHHPADCLHAIVNLGPTPPRGKRAIQGRIYWMEGSKEDLYDLWRKEFPPEDRP